MSESNTLLKKTHPPKVWVISDGRGLTGNLNACLGVADALDGQTETVDITEIISRGNVKAFLEDKLKLSHNHCEGAPNFIVSFFSNTAQIAAEIKQLLKDKTDEPVFLIQIRTPGKQFSSFDLIANPSHEKPVMGDNVMEITGVPHRVNKETLERGYRQWEELFSYFQKKKVIAVLLGGDTPSIPDYPDQGGTFTAEEAARLGKQMNDLAIAENANLLITNSPRTKKEAWQAFMNQITVPGYFHDVNMDHHNLEKGNPYIGMLAAADTAVVTADSTSMLSEAASTGKPVFVACEQASNLRDDHKKFVTSFIQKGHARLLSDNNIELVHRETEPLSTAAEIANEAKRRYELLLAQSQEKSLFN